MDWSPSYFEAHSTPVWCYVSENKHGFNTFSIEKLPIFVKICEKEAVDQGGLS